MMTLVYTNVKGIRHSESGCGDGSECGEWKGGGNCVGNVATGVDSCECDDERVEDDAVGERHPTASLSGRIRGGPADSARAYL